jgi:hypothetical protein
MGHLNANNKTNLTSEFWYEIAKNIKSNYIKSKIFPNGVISFQVIDPSKTSFHINGKTYIVSYEELH